MNTTGMSKHLRRVSAWAGAVCLATLVASCGGGGADGGEPPPTPSGTATIGSEGGSLSSAEGVRITVPAGAMAEAVTLRVARDTTGLHAALASGTPDPDKAVALSPTYAMTPHGTTFTQPVELRIPIDGADAAAAVWAQGRDWVLAIARDEVPQEFRAGFLERNPVNRDLLAHAARLGAGG